MCDCVCKQWTQGGKQICNIHHTEIPPLTSNFHDSMSSSHLSDVIKVDGFVCVCLFQTVMERTDERLRSWQMKKSPNTKKTIWLWSLMDAIGAFYSLSAFLFLSLSSFLPSLRLFLQSLWWHQSEWKSACTHMHLRWFRTWFICSKQLALMCGGLVTMSFFLTQSGDWYWWWPPCCFHSSLK